MLKPYELSEDQKNDQLLLFKLDSEFFAIESRYVSATSNMLLISPMSGTPEYFKGIAKVEGKIIPVIDMRLKMCKKCKPYNEDTQIIIINLEGVQSGLIVDTVVENGLLWAEYSDKFDDYPEKNHYFKGRVEIGDSLAMIIDCKNMLMEDGIFDLAQLVS